MPERWCSADISRAGSNPALPTKKKSLLGCQSKTTTLMSDFLKAVKNDPIGFLRLLGEALVIIALLYMSVIFMYIFS